MPSRIAFRNYVNSTPMKEKAEEETPDENKDTNQDAPGLDVTLEGNIRGTRTMRQQKLMKNNDDESSINDDFSLDQNSDPFAAKKQ